MLRLLSALTWAGFAFFWGWQGITSGEYPLMHALLVLLSLFSAYMDVRLWHIKRS